MSKITSKNKILYGIIFFCFVTAPTITSIVFASDDRVTSTSSNNDALIGLTLGGLLGGGGGTAIGSPFGHAGTGAIIGAEAGAIGGALLGAFMGDRQQGNQQVNNKDLSQPPRWTFSEEAIIFDRVGTDKWTLVERVSPSAPENGIGNTFGIKALDSTDLNQGYSAGMKLGVAYRLDPSDDISLSFFRSGNWDSRISNGPAIGPDNPLNWLVMRAPAGDFYQTQNFTFQSMIWDYSTELYNAEINMQHKLSDRVRILAGFRWLQLHENLKGDLQPEDPFLSLALANPNNTLYDIQRIETQGGIAIPPPPPFWNTSTTNNLYGFQIGVDGKILEYRHFSINAMIKGGPYLNHASQLTGVSMTKTIFEAGSSTNHAAFVCEGGLQFKYQVSRAITVKLGYEVLWLEGVALAPGQIGKTYIIYPATANSLGVNSDSNVLFHGATAGVEFSF